MSKEAMLSKEADLFLNDSWRYEIKEDGDRAILSFKVGQKTKITNRRGRETTYQFPEIVENLKLHPKVEECVLDGEMCVFIDGKSNFNEGIVFRTHLQDNAEIKRRSESIPATFVVFDILSMNGSDLTKFSYEQRRLLLEGVVKSNSYIRVTQSYSPGDVKKLWKCVLEEGLEGLMAKNINSKYEKGKRSNQWLKIKNWIFSTIRFTDYEINNAGITVTDGRHRVLVAGQQHHEVRDSIDRDGYANLKIRHLVSKTKTGALREPTFHGVVKVNIKARVKDDKTTNNAK